MRDNFDAALAAVLRHEGGFVNDPQDPGGATNRGVTQAVYNQWRADKGLNQQSVRFITPAEVRAIYKRRYWDAVRGDDLPSGVDYATFDFAVNSGVKRAVRFLQLEAGADPDGVMGPVSLAAIRREDAAELIRDLCASRQTFLNQLPHFHRFGRGWTRRVNEVREKSLELVA